MALNITLQNPIGLSGIDDGIVFDANTPTLIPSIYENSNFSVEIVYQLTDDAEVPVDIPTQIFLQQYSCENINGLLVEVIDDNILKLSGTPIDVFIDAFYKFVMPDYSIKNLKPDTQEDFLALIEWSPPSNKIRQFNHTITTVVTDTVSLAQQDHSLSITQSVHWLLQPALAKFYEFLSKGKI